MKFCVDSIISQIKDKYTIQKGTPSIELMERAGFECFKIISKFINKNNKILVVVGPGGNGGDGYVIARYLFENHYDVTVLDINESHSIDCLTNLNRYKGKTIKQIENTKYDLVVDALFGVGLNKEVKEPQLSLIRYINNSHAKIVSIDINSGLDATTGLVLGEAVKSDLTICVQDIKAGLYLNEGRDYCMNKVLIDIGILHFDGNNYYQILENNDFKSLVLDRKSHSNKGNYGRSLIIGGSKEYLGAPLLSYTSLASLRSGSGYATLAVPKTLIPIYGVRYAEVLFSRLNDDGNGHYVFDEKEANTLLNYSSIALGMGMGISEEVYKLVCYLLLNYKGNLILDADALNSISKYGVDCLKTHICDVIISPHIKEFSRLANTEISVIERNYGGLARDFANKYNLIVLLKNNTSIITDGKTTYLNVSGSPCLAKGGSGDVLSGILCGICSTKDNLLKRVALSSYILGRSSEFCVLSIDENCVIATDVINNISNVFKEIKHGKI
jgi:ADP-dependent NAD(P)H-hydrate dehydratase / NAD(P)H-hydrate epimerase